MVLQTTYTKQRPATGLEKWKELQLSPYESYSLNSLAGQSLGQRLTLPLRTTPTFSKLAH